MPTPTQNVLDSRTLKASTLLTAIIVVSCGIAISTLAVSAGIYYFFVRSERIHIDRTMPGSSETATHESDHIINLDTFTVNLADLNKTAYLRVGLSIRASNRNHQNSGKLNNNEESKALDQDNLAALRDIALITLGRQTSEKLLSPNGKDNLKSELIKEINAKNKQLIVTNVYFSEFLVQQ
jgi:flagellar protein FliL